MGHNKPFGSSPETEESLGSLPGKVAEGVKDEVDKVITSLWDQMLGGSESHDSGSGHGEHPAPHDAKSAASHESSHDNHASEGSEIKKVTEGILFQLGLHGKSSEKHQQNSENHVETRRAGIDYSREIIDAGRNSESREQREFSKKIEEIMNELRQLIASTKELKHHFADIAVAPPPKTPGKYHENFFEWLLIMVKQAKSKVEDSKSWLGAIKGKGSKGKGDYWDRAEKEGTTFTQSMDRSASTSVG